MIVKVRLILMSVALSMVATEISAAPRAPVSYIHEAVATNYRQLAEPSKNPPPFNEADYAGYMNSTPGSSTVSGTISVPLSNGKSDFCAGVVVLYPDTPYVRWLLQTWVRFSDGKSSQVYNGIYPDYTDQPAILKVNENNGDDPTRAVRSFNCNIHVLDGKFVFHQVRAGKYLILGNVQHFLGYRDGPSESRGVIVQTGAGEQYDQQTTQGSMQPSWGDAYDVLSKGPIPIGEHDNTDYGPDAFETVVRNPYDLPARTKKRR